MTHIAKPYTAPAPIRRRSSEELRSTIPGWGVDLDRNDRPAVPKERFDPSSTGAHWEFPERQLERWPRERSVEHALLPPVFGTSCPPRGLSGLLRRYAYRFSEGRTAHWTLLMLADRIDVAEQRVLALAKGRPDNVVTETGVLAEYRRHGIRSRVGQHRADLVHQPMSLLGFAVPALLAVGAAYMVSRRAGGRSIRSSLPSAWRAGERGPRSVDRPMPAPRRADSDNRGYDGGDGRALRADLYPAE